MTRKILFSTLILFGLMTLFVSSAVLFDWFGIRQKEGNYVPAVVWANWLCGALYLLSAFFVFKVKASAKYLLSFALGILFIANIYLFFHIKSGGLYETKTIAAMAFRTILTGIFLLTTLKLLKK